MHRMLDRVGDLVHTDRMNAGSACGWTISAILLALLCVTADAQAALQTGSVHGTVYLADTGKAAVGAIVSLLPPADQQAEAVDPKTGRFVVKDQPHRGDFHATVDSTGTFEIEGVKTGSYYVLTYLAGYISQDDYVYPGALSPEVNPSAGVPPFVRKVHVTSGNVEQINLYLQRGGQITGSVGFARIDTVHTRLGMPREVALSLAIRGQNGEFTRTGGAAHTDADGNYRFEGLAPGSYVIFAALPGQLVTTRRGVVGSGGELVFCCSGVRASKARLIEIRGKELHDHVEIEIPSSGLHKITGKALASTGTAVIDDAIVRLYPAGEPGFSRTTSICTDGTLSFEDVPDEDYTIALEFEPHADFVGLTEDKSGIIMRMLKPQYTSVRQNIRVAGQDPPTVLLKTEALPTDDSATR